MNFFKDFDALNNKYSGNPEHKQIAADYVQLLHNYLLQLKEQAQRTTKKQS